MSQNEIVRNRTIAHLLTEISITAPPDRIWHLLTDFASYPQWNPFIRRAIGLPREGAQLEVYLQPTGARGMTFRPRVLKAEANRELRWLKKDTKYKAISVLERPDGSEIREIERKIIQLPF